MRRLGATALLTLWFPVATANAVTCVLACSFADQHQTMPGMHHENGDGHHDRGHSSHHYGNSVSDGTSCGLSQIMALSFVETDHPVAIVAATPEFIEAHPAPTAPISFKTAFEPPPPRAA